MTEMTEERAARVIDWNVQRIRERDGVDYGKALRTLAREKPELVESWRAVQKKERGLD
jgi:hypothetical protein